VDLVEIFRTVSQTCPHLVSLGFYLLELDASVVVCHYFVVGYLFYLYC